MGFGTVPLNPVGFSSSSSAVRPLLLAAGGCVENDAVITDCASGESIPALNQAPSSPARLPPTPFERAPAGRLDVLGAELSQFLAGSSVQLLVALMTLLGQAPEGKKGAGRAASYAQCVPTF